MPPEGTPKRAVAAELTQAIHAIADEGFSQDGSPSPFEPVASSIQLKAMIRPAELRDRMRTRLARRVRGHGADPAARRTVRNARASIGRLLDAAASPHADSEVARRMHLVLASLTPVLSLTWALTGEPDLPAEEAFRRIEALFDTYVGSAVEDLEQLGS